jgi:hypothetical protein
MAYAGINNNVLFTPMRNKSRAISRRQNAGQSMVEYALGIGCIAALCMVALGSLGHICGHMVHAVEQAINYGGQTSQHPEETVNLSATPWNLN